VPPVVPRRTTHLRRLGRHVLVRRVLVRADLVPGKGRVMARSDRQRRRGQGKLPRKVRHRKWRTWHHGKDEARTWQKANERLDAELIESIEHGGTVHPRPEVPS
jgi:hypothetical protein